MPVWTEGEKKREKFGHKRKSSEERDVTVAMYLEDLKKLLLWLLTHQWGKQTHKHTHLHSTQRELLDPDCAWIHPWSVHGCIPVSFISPMRMTQTLTAHEYKAPWIESQTSSSLLSIISHVNKRQRNKQTKRETARQRKKDMKKKTDRETERKRSEFENITNGCQGRGSCTRPCFHGNPNVLSVQWRQSGALRCGRADMSHTCQCPADSTEHTPMSIHSTSVTPGRDTGSPVWGPRRPGTQNWVGPGVDGTTRWRWMDTCMERRRDELPWYGLCHPLSDLCPDWQTDTWPHSHQKDLHKSLLVLAPNRKQIGKLTYGNLMESSRFKLSFTCLQ